MVRLPVCQARRPVLAADVQSASALILLKVNQLECELQSLRSKSPA